MSKKTIFLFVSIIAVLLSSCDFHYTEEMNMPMSYEKAKELLGKKLVLNQEDGSFSFSWSNENDGIEIPEDFIKQYAAEIATFNQSIKDKIDSGEVVTLFDGKNKKTFNKEDEYDEIEILNSSEMLEGNLRSGDLLWSCNISNGWANPWKAEFTTTADHVTSTISIGGTNNSYYSVTLECATGNSSFGKKHSLYGTSYIAGAVRHWWYEKPKTNTRTGITVIPEYSYYDWKFYVTSTGNNDSYGSVNIKRG